MEHNGYDGDKIEITYSLNEMQRDAVKNQSQRYLHSGLDAHLFHE